MKGTVVIESLPQAFEIIKKIILPVLPYGASDIIKSHVKNCPDCF